MEATTEFHKKVSIEQSSFSTEQDTVTCCMLRKPQTVVKVNRILIFEKAGLYHCHLLYVFIAEECGICTKHCSGRRRHMSLVSGFWSILCAGC